MTTAAPTEPKRKAVDTSTRYESVYARHELRCAKALDKTRRCSCTPGYYGKVYDPAIGRYRVTKPRVKNVLEAKSMKDDLLALVRSGSFSESSPDDGPTVSPRFSTGHTEFIAECKAGIARAKKGQRYTKKSIRSLDSDLKSVPAEIRDRLMSEITRGELQKMVDGFLRKPLSSSRIANIVNAVRSFYRWAIDRGLVLENPAELVRLPADDSDGEHRIATPGEFADLLDGIPAEDALAWAIAGYATARHQEIEILGWEDVDFKENAILLAGDEDARKSEAARRIVPMVRQLRDRLHAEWDRQGRPKSGPVFRPRRADNRSGTADLGAMLRRITRRWKSRGKVPITFQDSRHTAATWLDHAGVSPKVASVIMGHKAPKLKAHPDAAPIATRSVPGRTRSRGTRVCRRTGTRCLDHRRPNGRRLAAHE
jgi:integrase